MSDAGTSIRNLDPIVRGLLPGYLQRRIDELIKLKQLLIAGDFEKIEVVGHNLSGSGGAYGLETLTVFGRKIERAAAERNREELGQQLHGLQQYLERIGAELG